MAKGKQRREQKKRKNQQRQPRQRQIQPHTKQLTPRLAQKVDDAYDLIRCRKYSEAEEQLSRLLERKPHPAVVEAQLFLYQTTEDHQQCSRAAKRLVNLTPHDPDARLMYTQESMFCGRTGIALANYRLFLQRWPDRGSVV